MGPIIWLETVFFNINSCKKRGHSPRVFGKRIRERNFGANFFQKSPVNRALPKVRVCINEKKRTALVDTGCSQILVRKLYCQTWKRKEVHMFTVGGCSLICCRESVVRIGFAMGPLSLYELWL